MTVEQMRPVPPPYTNLFPLPAPQPIGDCPECRRLVTSRRKARETFDRSAATDCNILLRAHQQGEH